MFPASLPASYHLLWQGRLYALQGHKAQRDLLAIAQEREKFLQLSRCGAGATERVQLIAGGERNPVQGKQQIPRLQPPMCHMALFSITART